MLEPDRASVRFSVIVPTLGLPGRLSPTLASLACQTYPRAMFELLVGFDGVEPSPEAAEACASAGARTVVLPHRVGPGGTRNACARVARGEILAFTEDDCDPDPAWLELAARRFDADQAIDVLEGQTVKPGGRPVRRNETKDPRYLPTNLFVRAARFAAVGGYCEDYFDHASGVYFREDSDLGFTLEAAGAAIAREPLVRVTHPDEHPRFLDPIRWARRYMMDPLLARRHPQRFRDRIEVHRLGPLRIRRPVVRASIAYIGGLALTVAGSIAGLAPVTWIGIGLIVAGLAIIWAKWGFEPRRLPLVPIVPLVMVYSLADGSRRAEQLAGGVRHTQ